MFYEVFIEEEKALRGFLSRSIKAAYTPKTIQASQEQSPPAALISIRTQSIIPPAWAGSVKGVLSRSQGFDHLCGFLDKAKSKVSCGYLLNYCSTAVAEHALMAAMILLKKTKRQISAFSSFDRNNLTGKECRGRRAVVIGVGNIGRQIVLLGKALGMTVRGVDVQTRFKDVDYVSLREGLMWGEVIFCALPLTERTRGLLGYENLKKAQKGTVFVNVSRGEISPAEDIKRLLDEGLLAGVSLDVCEDEPDLAEELQNGEANSAVARTLLELAGRDNVLLTPHNAFNTEESVQEKSRQAVRAIEQFLREGRFPQQLD